MAYLCDGVIPVVALHDIELVSQSSNESFITLDTPHADPKRFFGGSTGLQNAWLRYRRQQWKCRVDQTLMPALAIALFDGVMTIISPPDNIRICIVFISPLGDDIASITSPVVPGITTTLPLDVTLSTNITCVDFFTCSSVGYGWSLRRACASSSPVV